MDIQKIKSKYRQGTLTFREVDDALYLHEQPYNSYCACGFPPLENTMGNPLWVQSQEWLTKVWSLLCPYRRHFDKEKT